MTGLALALAAIAAVWLLWARTVAVAGLAGVMVTHHAPAPAVAAALSVLLAGTAALIFVRSLRATNGRLMTSTYPIGGVHR